MATDTIEQAQHCDAREKLFEPDDNAELLRGWLLHARKARERHDLAARKCEARRYKLGLPAIALPAIAGTWVFASIGTSPDMWMGLLAGAIAILAAVLTAIQTFLDYPNRAARHHAAGARYKAIIWLFEQALAGPDLPSWAEKKWIDGIREQLGQLEETAPVVAGSDYEEVERRFKHVELVGRVVMPPVTQRLAGGDAHANP